MDNEYHFVVPKDKYTSSIINKKCRRGKKRVNTCCSGVMTRNVTKPMKASMMYCGYVKFYKSREKMVTAKQEIRDMRFE